MGVLDLVGRKPQRLIVFVTAVLLLLSFSTYMTLSPTGYESVRTQIASIPHSWHRPGSGAGPSSASGIGSPAVDELAASPLAGMYTHNPGKPQNAQDMLKWATKGSDGNLYPPSFVPQMANTAPRAKAAFIVLVRNGEINNMRESMRDVEEKFNRKYGYPWVFLNNEPFSEEFKAGVRQMTRSDTHFGLIPKEHWSYPDWISQDKAAATRKQMKAENVIYGDSESYRHMCRFQSGFFFQHELLKDFDYYWRVEPGIKLFCDVDYDPFLFMQMNNKVYGFTMALHEYIKTVPSLYDRTKEFVRAHPEYVSKNAGVHFLTDEPDKFMERGWNLCHFWSNFEIGDLNFWRSSIYREYFDHLDKAGGFFYERWGDAPVHSIAATLFADKKQLHHFDDIGYYHAPWSHCPVNKKYHDSGRCNCKPSESFDREAYSCLKQWWAGSPEKEPLYVVPRTLREPYQSEA